MLDVTCVHTALCLPFVLICIPNKKLFEIKCCTSCSITVCLSRHMMENNRCLCLTNWVKLDQKWPAQILERIKAINVSVKGNYNPSLIKKFKAKINNGNTQTQTYNNLSPNLKTTSFPCYFFSLTLRKIPSWRRKYISEKSEYLPLGTFATIKLPQMSKLWKTTFLQFPSLAYSLTSLFCQSLHLN